MPSDRYDVIVLGAGAAGLTAAVVAALEGLSVLVIEKSPFVGGTTALSGGMVWMPANRRMMEAGLTDTAVDAKAYLDAVIGHTSEMQEVFLENASRCVDYLQRNTAVQLRPVVNYPDYYPNLAGATLGGRVLEPEPFDGRKLHKDLEIVRPPLPEFTLFGGMMVDRAHIPHFRKVFRSIRSTLCVGRLLLRYAGERLSHRRGTSLVLGNALVARLLYSARAADVDFMLSTTVTELHFENGAVAGASIAVGGKVSRLYASRGVVLATGGFGHNEELRSRYLPTPVRMNAGSPDNRGDGLLLGQSVGAVVKEGAHGNAFWVPISTFRRTDNSEGIFPHTVTDRSKPGVVAVNHNGRRFANEARSYHQFISEMLKANVEADAKEAFLICDSSFMWKYGLGAIRPFTWSLRRYIDQGYLYEAGTLQALAEKLKIDSAALVHTVARFNDGADKGLDPDFGRGGDPYQRYLGDADVKPNPCVAPIEKDPYYAIAIYPGDLGTAAGLAVAPDGNVLDERGKPIRGLYACGNDMASIMEGAYPGPGITLGPALTFGFLVAERLASGNF